MERLQSERKELEAAVVAAATKVEDLTREQSKAERDVEQVRARRERDEQRLQAGQVASPKDLENLQHEIESLTKRQSDLEDVQREIWERLDAATAEHDELRQKLSEVESRLEATERTRDEVYAAIDAEAENVRRDRAEAAADVTDELLALYEKIRSQQGGIGAAALRQRRCEGCRMELDTSYLLKVAAAPPDEVLRCEECRRILVRTADSGV